MSGLRQIEGENLGQSLALSEVFNRFLRWQLCVTICNPARKNSDNPHRLYIPEVLFKHQFPAVIAAQDRAGMDDHGFHALIGSSARNTIPSTL